MLKGEINVSTAFKSTDVHRYAMRDKDEEKKRKKKHNNKKKEETKKVI